MQKKKKKRKGRRRVVEVKFSKPVLVAPVRMHIHPLCIYCYAQGEHDTFLRDVAASYPLPACVSTGKHLVGHRKELPSQAYPKPVEGKLLMFSVVACTSAALWIKEEHLSAS